MQNSALGRMGLIVTDNGLEGFAIEADGQNAGKKGLFSHTAVHCIRIKGHARGRLAPAVHDAGYLALTTQAAARTFPCITTGFRREVEFNCHELAP